MNFFKKIIVQTRWLCCLFVFLAACKNIPGNYKQLKISPGDTVIIEMKNKRALLSISKAKSLIEEGDLVLRTGNDFTSECLRKLSLTDKTYSHCGIATIENDSVFIYHAMGGEWNPDEKLRRDPLELFCNPAENRGFGVFTFGLNDLQKRSLDSVEKSWYNKGLMFDMKFDLKTNDRMYCAEFVSKAFAIAAHRQISFSTTTINYFKYIAIDNLILNKFCKEKIRIRYQ